MSIEGLDYLYKGYRFRLACDLCLFSEATQICEGHGEFADVLFCDDCYTMALNDEFDDSTFEEILETIRSR